MTIKQKITRLSKIKTEYNRQSKRFDAVSEKQVALLKERMKILDSISPQDMVLFAEKFSRYEISTRA